MSEFTPRSQDIQPRAQLSAEEIGRLVLMGLQDFSKMDGLKEVEGETLTLTDLVEEGLSIEDQVGYIGPGSSVNRGDIREVITDLENQGVLKIEADENGRRKLIYPAPLSNDSTEHSNQA